MAQLDPARQPCQHLLAVGDLWDCVEKGLYHGEDRLDLRHGERYPGQGHERAGHHAVGRVEGVVVRHRNARPHRHIVHDDRPRKADGQTDDSIELQERRRVIGQPGTLGIKVAPPGKGALLRPGQPDLLYAGDEGIGHAALLAGKLHLPGAYLHLNEGGQQGEHNGHQDNDQRGHYQRRGIGEYLRYVYKGKQGCEPRGQHGGRQHLAEHADL